MSGGAKEYVAAYLGGAGGHLTGGNMLVNAETKYKDVYSGNSDDRQVNYEKATPNDGHYGDAVWETSNSGYKDKGAWHLDDCYFCFYGNPFLARGGFSRGLFSFQNLTNGGSDDTAFRIVIPVF